MCSLAISARDNATVDLSYLVKVEELEIAGLTLKNYHRLENLKKASFQSCEFFDQDISSATFLH
jgi:hypothetical protein